MVPLHTFCYYSSLLKRNNLMLLGTAAASTTTQFNISYVPQYLDITNIATVTRLRVTALGDGIILDLDAAGLAAVRNTRFQSIVATTALNRFFLANGIVKGKNCLIEIVNGATVSAVYASSQGDEGDGTMYFQSVIQKVFANTGTTFKRFGILALPSLALADYVQIEYNDGCNVRMDQAELRGLIAQYQALDGNANDFKVDNLDSIIQSVTVYCATDQQAYVQKYLAVAPIEGRF
jgi:hypothetical protein